MTKRIASFGGQTSGRLILANGHQEDVWFERELWFDRDIDGRWLVGVTEGPGEVGERTGAIVVRDEKVSAFIEVLGMLVMDPEHFADETFTIGPDWDGQLPEG